MTAMAVPSLLNCLLTKYKSKLPPTDNGPPNEFP